MKNIYRDNDSKLWNLAHISQRFKRPRESKTNYIQRNPCQDILVSSFWKIKQNEILLTAGKNEALSGGEKSLKQRHSRHGPLGHGLHLGNGKDFSKSCKFKIKNYKKLKDKASKK